MSLWQWADWLEPVAPEFRITLGEGNTPLVRSHAIGPRSGIPNLYFKLDYVNPSGSYKDRFAAAAISHLLAAGRSRCLATSSGNTGAALAAYSAAAGIRCEIAIVETAPVEKLKQMLAYGARLYRIRGFGIDPALTRRILTLLEQHSQRADTSLEISAFHYSPAGMSGVETVAFELADQHADGIDHVFCPAGGGGLALAVARGFCQLVSRGRLNRTPRIEVAQPAGNDTIATPLRTGALAGREIESTTRLSGLQVPNVVDGNQTLAECRATGGTGHVVEDELVWETQRRLAREEGIFCEPAAAVSVTAALGAVACGDVPADATIVCLITGSGFKDAPSVERMADVTSCPVLGVDEFAQALTDA